MAGYLIIRDIMIDLIDYASEILIRHSQSGWVLTEAILKPLARVLRIALLIAAGLLLMQTPHQIRFSYFGAAEFDLKTPHQIRKKDFGEANFVL